MFKIICANNCSLVLSYSNTGMISIDDLLLTAKSVFKAHIINVTSIDHQHMTMGRFNDRDRNVKELVITVKAR
jgi:adenine-specific DNA-methyltransferase